MTRTWVPDPGWTGDWQLPEVLSRPVTERERGALVAMSCGGAGPARLAKALADARSVAEATVRFSDGWRRALAHLGRLGARAIVPSDDEYPARLREIAAPPPLLFVRGSPLHELEPVLAIVGARACTSGAKRFARRLGEELAAAGFTVCSGLARGIDGAAHDGALSTGRTIAVLGTGIDVCYPSEHRELAERMARSGALVTEFPPGIGPRAWHFPARNRIISGASLALIVVEAGIGSGALITAQFALDQGREVFACITGPENPAGAGVREMIKDSARVIVDVDQAVEDMLAVARAAGFEVSGDRIRRGAEEPDEPAGQAGAVFAVVAEGTTVEEVVRATCLDAGRVAALLGELELDGRVVAEGGGRWRRADRR